MSQNTIFIELTDGGVISGVGATDPDMDLRVIIIEYLDGVPNKDASGNPVDSDGDSLLEICDLSDGTIDYAHVYEEELYKPRFDTTKVINFVEDKYAKWLAKHGPQTP